MDCLSLEQLCREIKDGQVMGYLNITGNSYPLTLCHMAIDCIQECDFTQLINFTTRRNNIDIFFTKRYSLIRKCHPLPGISDHEII